MDEQLKDVERGGNSADDHKPPIDPLRRVFVPVEKRTDKGTIVFRTSDRLVYCRAEEGGPIRRAVPKVRGKAARRADRLARRRA